MTKRILCAQIKHETNSFSPLPTGLDAFARRDLYFGDAALAANAGTATEVGAFIDAAAEYGWTLVPAVAADATPGGLVTADAWQRFADALVETAQTHGPFDGFLISLHGAMIAEGRPRADADLLAALRGAIGRAPVGIATFDLHGNIDGSTAQHLDGLTVYRTYPHVDVYECGREAAGLLKRALDTGTRPRLVIRQRPLLDGCDHGRSSGALMPRLIELGDRLRPQEGDVVAVFAGFPWGDVPHAGPSVAVTTTGAAAAAVSAAEQLLDEIWRTRATTSLAGVAPAAAVATADVLAMSGRRAVIADFSDNPGGGGQGDATALLRAIIGAPGPAVAVASMWDPATVERAEGAGVGSLFDICLGGSLPEFGGPPIEARAEVLALGPGAFKCEGPIARGKTLDLGRIATLRIGRADIIVASNRFQVTDRNHFRVGGLDPLAYPVLVVKSLQHFRAAFEPIADQIIFADSGALVSRDFQRFPYRQVRRPVWPLDDLA